MHVLQRKIKAWVKYVPASHVRHSILEKRDASCQSREVKLMQYTVYKSQKVHWKVYVY